MNYGDIYEESWWGYIGKAFGWGQVYPFNADGVSFSVDTTLITADTTNYTADKTIY